jgi:hypothetical protein
MIQAIPFLGMYLKEMKSTYQKDTCMPKFIVSGAIHNG